MKRVLALLLVVGMAISLFASCGSTKTGTDASPGAASSEPPASTAAQSSAPAQQDVTVKFLNMKVEIKDALAKMVPDFEKENPGIKLEIETVGGGADYKAAVMAKFSSGEAPDIWNNTGYSDLQFWQEKVEDLSDQPWIADMIDGAATPITKDGKIYGMPLAVEGFGFAYNKDLFAKAGITTLPNTLTSLEETCKKLQAAGIQPFSNGYAENWVLGLHNINVLYAHQANPQQYISDEAAGKIKMKDSPATEGWLKLLDLTVEYGQKNPATTGDYASSVAAFSSGTAAMIQQGNWIQPDLDKVDKNLNVGFLPMPISDTPDDKINAGIPNYLVVNNASTVKDAAKTFLNWLVSSDTGRRYLTDELLCVPAFKSIKSSNIRGLNAALVEYANAGKTYPWIFPMEPDGAFPLIGSEMMKYVSKQITADELCVNIDKITVDKAAAAKK